MDNNTFFKEKMLPFNASSVGGELYASYLESAQAYPDYLDEIRGMADGAELSFSEVILVAMHFEQSSDFVGIIIYIYLSALLLNPA